MISRWIDVHNIQPFSPEEIKSFLLSTMDNIHTLLSEHPLDAAGVVKKDHLVGGLEILLFSISY